MPGAPHTGRDAEFGSQAAPKNDPWPAFLPNRQFPNGRHAIQDREPGEALLLRFTIPPHRHGTRLVSGLETRLGTVFGQVYDCRLGSPG
jgi:hypothetical protein